MLTTDEVVEQTGGTVVTEDQDFFAMFDAEVTAFQATEPLEEKTFDVKPLRGDYIAEIRDFKRVTETTPWGQEKDCISLNLQIVEDERSKDDKGVNWYLTHEFSCKDLTNQAGEVYSTAQNERDRLMNTLYYIGVTEDQMGTTVRNLASLMGKQVCARVKPRMKKNAEGKWEVRTNTKGYPQHKFEIVPMPASEDAGM